MSDTKTDAKTESKTETPAMPAQPAAPALPQKGDIVRLRAVHGYIQHPFLLTEFDTDREVKVEFDGWHLVQIEGRKLVVTE